ncbi:transporter substrate-binding domain-containing protein [Fluviispira multicolorata]|uniref:Transporter substrate-binding domain-containing protein n=1 Tax=Fluviispira multicolorata TaxID=2654512 RepID=A0A833N4Y3_9BACT|nr:transporter substrate-binding domain-containing protein [Fluviispira multicolorata]KAB8029183.1 transporter substrate-binding domain-containing protein [Fluviispira multicolorata]
MRICKKVTTVFLTLVMSSSLFASEKSDKSFVNVQKKGEIRVCSQAGFIPFEMKDQKGNWKGFDVDIMQKFAELHSLKLKMIDTSLDGLIPALMTKKCDLIASGLTITEKRSKAVLFSNPVFTVKIAAAFLDTKENRSKFKKFSDIDHEGVKIASHTGSAATLYLRRTLKNANHLQFDSESAEVDALIQKRSNTFVDDNVFIDQASKEMNMKFYTLESTEEGKLAMAARMSDIALIEAFNNFLEVIDKNGQYEKIKKVYFN